MTSALNPLPAPFRTDPTAKRETRDDGVLPGICPYLGTKAGPTPLIVRGLRRNRGLMAPFETGDCYLAIATLTFAKRWADAYSQLRSGKRTGANPQKSRTDMANMVFVFSGPGAGGSMKQTDGAETFGGRPASTAGRPTHRFIGLCAAGSPTYWGSPRGLWGRMSCFVRDCRGRGGLQKACGVSRRSSGGQGRLASKQETLGGASFSGSGL